ncbi:MAG: iron dicitrate transport regulator FecR [Phenylobacterium zucineum]|nr:MAG: iron dicitrate transport regulator FecR [Phenylobacterium zucineum]
MSDPRPSPPKLEEAAAWLVRLRNRSITTKSLREFGDWRLDPANDAAFQEVQATWDHTGALANDPEILRATDAVLTAPSKVRKPWFTWPRAGFTAALAGLALAAGVLAPGLMAPTYATDVGQQLRVRLPDGSSVMLNTDSRLRVAYRDGERRLLLLRGEAFFDVARDPRRPFIVEAAGAAVRAVGTRFEVRRDAGAVQVTLVEGVVQVRQDKGPAAWTLRPNQKLSLSAAGAGTPRAADAVTETSWTTGQVHFHNTPFIAAIAEMNRYADRKIRLDAPDLGTRGISGIFNVGDTGSFVRGVSELYDLEAARGQDGGVILRRPATPPG